MKSNIKSFNQFIKEQVNNNIQELTFYNVSLESDDSSDLIYHGTDEDDAFYEFNSYSDIPSNMINRDDLSVIISKYENKYEFIYELDEEFETIDDYPIEDYYDDKTVYKLIDDGEYEQLEYRKINAANKESDILLSDVTDYFYKKYGKHKYNTINVYDESENYLGCIQLRISDHTENVFNNDRYESCDYYLSVVISDYDVTENRFKHTNAFERRRNEYEMKFNSEYDSDDVIEQIEDKINELKDKLSEK